MKPGTTKTPILDSRIMKLQSMKRKQLALKKSDRKGLDLLDQKINNLKAWRKSINYGV